MASFYAINHQTRFNVSLNITCITHNKFVNEDMKVDTVDMKGQIELMLNTGICFSHNCMPCLCSFYQHGLTLIQARISNHIHYKG